jgi:hypothetical protein
MTTHSEPPNQITTDTQEAYLDKLGWTASPFDRPATADEYVLTSAESISDITSRIQNYSGPLLLHSPYSGVGETTLLNILLESFDDDFTVVKIERESTNIHDLIATLADKSTVEPHQNTKLTKQRLRDELTNRRAPTLVGVDGLDFADEEILYALQEFADLPNLRVILSGTVPDWQTISQLGTVGQMFQRNVSYQLALDTLSRDQGRELYQRRVASVTDYDHDNYEEVPLDPFTEVGFKLLHTHSRGKPSVMINAFSTLLDRAAARYQRRRTDDIIIASGHVRKVDYNVSKFKTNTRLNTGIFSL